MKSLIPFALTSGLILASAMPAVAETSAAESGPYLGAKIGRLDIDAGYEVDDPAMTGFVLGYNFGGWAIELERNSGEGSLTEPFGGSSYDFDVDTTAAYFAYRTQGEVYFKVKAGWLEEEIAFDYENENINESDTGFSAGIGAGFRGEIFRIELEVTRIEEDAILLGAGLIAQF